MRLRTRIMNKLRDIRALIPLPFVPLFYGRKRLSQRRSEESGSLWLTLPSLGVSRVELPELEPESPEPFVLVELPCQVEPDSVCEETETTVNPAETPDLNKGNPEAGIPPVPRRITNLPVELTTMIFSYFPDCSLVTVGQTCHRFYQICLRERLKSFSICTSKSSILLKILEERADLRPAVRNLRIVIEPPDGWPLIKNQNEYLPYVNSQLLPCYIFWCLLPPFNKPEVQNAISKHFFDNVRHIEIKGDVDHLRSFIEIINCLSDHRPLRLRSLSIKLGDTWDQGEMELTQSELGLIRYPRGLTSLQMHVSDCLRPFNMLVVFGLSTDTLTMVDITTCYLRERYDFDQLVVCPNVKVLKVTRDLYYGQSRVEIFVWMFPNVDTLYLNPKLVIYGNAWVTADYVWPDPWLLQWTAMKNVKTIEIQNDDRYTLPMNLQFHHDLLLQRLEYLRNLWKRDGMSNLEVLRCSRKWPYDQRVFMSTTEKSRYVVMWEIRVVDLNVWDYSGC
ncbi:hypothetical protein TWF225_004200 [Orbilia oligospora]|nr:hypothetical protein TWF225_004200 [Orbilia oligospora]KAF3267239.1 hypothetical protein TWF128_010174 [Orbilia oligospora]KAF3272794.1 hypothetical protein TWF217_000256 [Orbilia oligospora]